MKKQHTFTNSYTEQLIEKGQSTSDLSLWNGKMGIAIYLFHLSRITKNDEYEIRASRFIEEIIEKVSYEIPISYADGLTGIGCGIEYIIEKGFVEGNGDEILAEIDQLVHYSIDTRPLKSLALSNGVCGIGFYLHSRLKNKEADDDSIITLKNREVLIYLMDWMEELLLETNDQQEINDMYFLLCRLHRLDVFNFRVDKMLRVCMQKIADLNFPMQDNYELWGINSLELLKPWM